MGHKILLLGKQEITISKVYSTANVLVDFLKRKQTMEKGKIIFTLLLLKICFVIKIALNEMRYVSDHSN